jgi:RNA polymerase sigma-B factor
MTAPPAVSDPSCGLTRRQVRERTDRAITTRAATSSERRRQELLEYIVRINLGVAADVVSRFADGVLETEELMEVARAALTRTVHELDRGCGDEFLSHAVPAIRDELRKHLGDRDQAVEPQDG